MYLNHRQCRDCATVCDLRRGRCCRNNLYCNATKQCHKCRDIAESVASSGRKPFLEPQMPTALLRAQAHEALERV